jgi:hypothetical protein
MTDPYSESAAITEEQLEQLADLVATRLTAMQPAAKPMLTVAEIARTFKVSRAWVYENAARLGGVKLGPGDRAPLRFDPERVAQTLRPLPDLADASSSATSPPPAGSRRRQAKRLHPVYDG